MIQESEDIVLPIDFHKPNSSFLNIENTTNSKYYMQRK